MKYHARLLALFAGIVVSGCATSASSGVSDQVVVRERSSRNDPGDPLERTPGATSAVVPLQHPASRVWPLVPSAYSVLQIPLVGLDTVNRVVTGQIVARRNFGGRPMDMLVDCGRSISGPNAATYLVNIMLTSRVIVTAPETATLRTTVEASGQATDGSTVRCSSSGLLEKSILERVQTGLGQ